MSSVVIRGTSGSQSGGGTPWTNPSGYFGTSSITPATVSLSSFTNPTSQVIEDSGYPTNQVPLGSALVGIQYSLTASGSGAQFVNISCIINGKSDTSNIGQTLTGSFVGYGAGGPTTIPSGLSTVTVADINTGIISVSNSVTVPSGPATINEYNSNITVYYTSPTTITSSFGLPIEFLGSYNKISATKFEITSSVRIKPVTSFEFLSSHKKLSVNNIELLSINTASFQHKNPFEWLGFYQPTLQANAQNSLVAFFIGDFVTSSLSMQAQNSNSSFDVHDSLFTHFTLLAQNAITAFHVTPINTVTLGAAAQHSSGSFHVINTPFAVTLTALAQHSTTSLNALNTYATHFVAHAQNSTTSLHANALFHVNLAAAAQVSHTNLHVLNSLGITLTAVDSHASASFTAFEYQNVTGQFGAIAQNVISNFNALTYNNAINLTAISQSAFGAFNADIVTQPTTTITLGASAGFPAGSFHVGNFVGTNTLHAAAQNAIASFNVENAGQIFITLGASANSASTGLNVTTLTDQITMTAAAQHSMGSFFIGKVFDIAVLGANAQNSSTNFHVNYIFNTATLNAIAQNSSASFDVNQYQNISGTLSGVAQNSIASFHANNFANVATLGAIAGVSTSSINVLGKLGTTLQAQASSSQTNLNILNSQVATLHAAAQNSTTSLNILWNDHVNFQISSQASFTSFNVHTGNICTITAIAQPSSLGLLVDNSTLITSQIQGSITGVLKYLANWISASSFSPQAIPNVVISILEYPPQTPGTPFVQLYPGSFTTNLPSVYGSGRYCTIVEGWIDVKIYVRNLLDQAYQDANVIFTQGETGIYYIADTLSNRLQLCFPTDNVGNFICSEPPRVGKWKKVKRVINGEEYAGLVMRMFINIELTLTPVL